MGFGFLLQSQIHLILTFNMLFWPVLAAAALLLQLETATSVSGTDTIGKIDSSVKVRGPLVTRTAFGRAH